MSFWQSVLRNEIHHFEQAYPGSKDCTSEEMHRAVQDWFSLYFDREVTEQEDLYWSSFLVTHCSENHIPYLTSIGVK